jgi:hypothetical protein
MLKKALKILGLSGAIVILTATIALAEFLVCDPQAGVTHYDIEVDGILVESMWPAEADGSVAWNVDHLGGGQMHQFRLKAYDTSGWGSDYSSPFDARKPNGPGNARISQ